MSKQNKHLNYVLGVDIGSTEITIANCELSDKGEICLRGVGSAVTAGMKKGVITDQKELRRSIERALKRVEQSSGYRPERAMVNVPLDSIDFIQNVGFVMSKSDTGQITEAEKTECIRRAKNIAKSVDHTLLHVIPLYFKVDDQEVRNPVGVFGRHLEVKVHIILLKSETIKSLSSIFRELGLRIEGFAYDGIAASQVLMTPEERREGGVLMDVGGRFTKVSIFKNNLLYRSVVIPVGGETFTQDLAHVLGVNVPEAERLKIVYGDVLLGRVDREKKVSVNSKDGGRKELSKFYICQIVEARLKELLQLIYKELGHRFEAPYTIVMAGGGSQIIGFSDYCRKEFAVSVREGLPSEVKSVIEHPSNASAIGLVLYALKMGAISYNTANSSGIKNTLTKVLGRIF